MSGFGCDETEMIRVDTIEINFNGIVGLKGALVSGDYSCAEAEMNRLDKTEII